MLFILYNVILTVILLPLVLFWGPFEALKIMAVGSVATSRHPQVVQAFLSDEEILRIMNSNSDAGFIQREIEVSAKTSDEVLNIIIEDIQGTGFKGKIMLIKDPERIKLAVTKELGTSGERLSDMVKDMGAVAGINAGGFYDHSGKGNGAFPDGLTIKNNELIHNNVGDRAVNIVGFDNHGTLVIGNMNTQELKERNIRDAVTFEPNLILDGQPLIQGDGGYGAAPRTGIGQKADGTVIIVVIDGRQPTWSFGASMGDLMNIFIKYDAVNAANLDGGSSSEMIYNGKIVNKLWNIFGERYIPTAFVVMP